MINFSTIDIVAVSFFALEWFVYAYTLEHTAYGRTSLSARMNVYREVWIREMVQRNARMVDTQIMASLQSGTAWFASTTLLAIGGTLALVPAGNQVMPVMQKLHVPADTSNALWELKCLGLILILVYAFFKFAWGYRLFNYVAILIGASPEPSTYGSESTENHIRRTSEMFQAGGRQFNRGQRAFFFALGYLGWFVSPWLLLITTASVVVVSWRRQFSSNAWRAMN